MDFKKLRSFVVVAEELHVARAAEKLGITQPALSNQICQLELQLGVPLFSRESRRLTLTHAGSLFRDQAQVALTETHRAVELARRAARGDVDHLRIGLVDPAPLGPVTREQLGRFREAHPSVGLVVQASSAGEQVGAIKDGRLDLGLMWAPQPSMPKELSSLACGREELVVCMPAGHVLAGEVQVSAGDLADETFLVSDSAALTGLAGYTALLGMEASFVPRTISTGSQVTTVCYLVASGFGIAVVPASLRIPLAEVVYRPLASPVFAEVRCVSRVNERRPHVLAARELLTGVAALH